MASHSLCNIEREGLVWLMYEIFYIYSSTWKLLTLQYDETVIRFKQDWGPVTGVSFRTGNAQNYFYVHLRTVKAEKYVQTDF